MTLRLTLTSLFAASLMACTTSPEYAAMCEDVVEADAQVTCLEDAAALARLDVDERERDALRDVRTAEGERDVRERTDRTRDEVERITDETRDEVRDQPRDAERSRRLHNALTDLEDEVGRLERDLDAVRAEDRDRDRDSRDERDERDDSDDRETDDRASDRTRD